MKQERTKRPLLRRLDDVLRKGNLTVTELARWLERPDSTVRTWMVTGRLRGPPDDVLKTMHLLRQLEKAVGAGLPVPTGLSRKKRQEYLSWTKKNG